MPAAFGLCRGNGAVTMKQKILYMIWGCLYVLCVGMGTLEDPQGFGKWVLVALAVIFFVPGGLLLYDALQARDRRGVRRIRRICMLSLGLTLAALVANFCTIKASEAVGETLYDILNLVSAPMLCGQYWILSLFLWACLLFAGMKKLPKAE